MTARKYHRGFTLVEVLSAVALTIVLIALLAKTFGAFYKVMSSSQATSNISDRVGTAAVLMEREMSCAVVRTNAHRFLNLRASEDGNGVKIYFCVPEENVFSPAEMSFVRHICYFWDRTTSNIYRAACVGESSSSNPNRLGKITPAYQSSGDPYAWISSTEMQHALSQAAQSASLLSGVENFQVMFYTSLPVKEESPDAVNQWNNAAELPRCLRICFDVADTAGATNQTRHSFSIPVCFPQYGVRGYEDY